MGGGDEIKKAWLSEVYMSWHLSQVQGTHALGCHWVGMSWMNEEQAPNDDIQMWGRGYIVTFPVFWGKGKWLTYFLSHLCKWWKKFGCLGSKFTAIGKHPAGVTYFLRN